MRRLMAEAFLKHPHCFKSSSWKDFGAPLPHLANHSSTTELCFGKRSSTCKERKTNAAKEYLSLGRVDPAPHTQHLLGPFAPIAQNSALWSFSIVDSLANRQHNCGGSEELAILETAGSGLAARSFWEQLGVAWSSWAPPTRSSSE